MAVVLQGAIKPNPGACAHRVATIVADGTRTIESVFVLADLDEPLTDEEIRAVLKAWGKYHKSRGVALATLIGKTIFAEIAP
jgi:hypothetical protein